MSRKTYYPVIFYPIDENVLQERPDIRYTVCSYPGVRPGHYSISNYGDVVSHYNNSIMSPWKDKDEHLRISLCTTKERNEKRYKRGVGFFVHRLVANEYLDPPDIPERTCINHINCIPYDNYYKNLEWCTDLENKIHASKNGLIWNSGEDNPTHKFTEENVRSVCSLLEKGLSPFEICETLHISGKTEDQVYDLSRHIKAKHIWRHISKEYNIK